MKRSRLGVVLVLAVASLVPACAPRGNQPETAAGQTLKTLPGSGPVIGGSGSASSPSPSPSPGEPGAGCPQGCDTPPAGCVIKGNINIKTGDRVYHMPGQIHYDNVTIEPERGERWFCTEDEALANGWRRAKR